MSEAVSSHAGDSAAMLVCLLEKDGRRSLEDDERAWLLCAAHMAEAGKREAGRLWGTLQSRSVLRMGAGGDRTLHIDDACEQAMLSVLARESPGPFFALSEEAGTSGDYASEWRVLVDPLDGSLNAKRGMTPFAASVGLAKGEVLKDVMIGYVEDYTRPWRFAAVKGVGAVMSRRENEGQLIHPSQNMAPLAPDTVEVILLEVGSPAKHSFALQELSVLGAESHWNDMRIRQVGSLALSLCYIAAGLADVLVAAVRSRSVDLAAGLLVLAEAGGGAVALGGAALEEQPLDLERRSAFVAWRPGLDPEVIQARVARLSAALLL